MTEVRSEMEGGYQKPYKISHRCFYFSKEVILFVKSCSYNHVYSSLFD
jgi:hypothetical protein